jgi:DNA-binding GntR family transcriptional regulator
MTTPLRIDTSHGHRRNALVQSMLADIIQGHVTAGERLVTQDLSVRYGVSHTPIREALITLAGMGLVELVPNKGAIARQITTNEVAEVLQVRRVLECEAVKRSCGRIDVDTLRDLSVQLRKIRDLPEPASHHITEARILDNRLHDLIAESCGNLFLHLELERLMILFRGFRDASWQHDQSQNDFRRLKQEAEEHLKIVDALSRNTPREAANAMAAHLKSGLKYWSRAIPKMKKELTKKPRTDAPSKG